MASGYRAKDHFHVPRKSKTKQRPSEQDILENYEELAVEDKFRYHRPKKHRFKELRD